MIYNNHIPSSFIPEGFVFKTDKPRICVGIPSAFLNKVSQLVPEQMINETVQVYEEALPYIKCEIQSTIQHEAGHRKDEEGRHQSQERGEKIIPFEEFTASGRAEGIAEQEEEDCRPPSEVSGRVVSVNLNDLFEEAKSSARLPSGYSRDVRAGTLEPSAQGMYLMQDFQQMPVSSGKTSNAYEGFDGTLWVDVRKIVSPFIVQGQKQDGKAAHPATFQDDGVKADVPGVSRESPVEGAIPSTPSTPSVPSIGAR